eukprot:TRINITY_DN9341_c0_g1_i2.p1 TRINITY_DN9341_c0_g1~~TRINITY_DN9341_c0_g1_i2.p1  ORF type:complete len:317 (+),score=77.88 TRINITY_DN9341_c0_g1_i2:89-1039(+)
MNPAASTALKRKGSQRGEHSPDLPERKVSAHCPATGLPYAKIPVELSALSSPNLLFIGHADKVHLTLGGMQKRVVILTYQRLILAEQDGPIKRLVSVYSIAKLFWKRVRRSTKHGDQTATLQVLLLLPSDKHLLLIFTNRDGETAEASGFNFISVVSKVRGVQQSLGSEKDRCAPKEGTEIWNGSEELTANASIMEKLSAPYKIVLDRETLGSGRLGSSLRGAGGSSLALQSPTNRTTSSSDDAITGGGGGSTYRSSKTFRTTSPTHRPKSPSCRNVASIVQKKVESGGAKLLCYFYQTKLCYADCNQAISNASKI